VRNRFWFVICFCTFFTIQTWGETRIEKFQSKFALNSGISRLAEGDTHLNFILVQPNAQPKILSSREQLLNDLRKSIAMSEAKYNDFLLNNPDAHNYKTFIIWPESGVPLLLDRAEKSLLFLSDISEEGRILVTGIDRHQAPSSAENTGELGEFNNCLIVVKDGQIVAYYAKRELVPFGEYIPLHGFLGRFFPPIVDIISFTPGKNRGLQHEIPNKLNKKSDDFFNFPNFAPYICSEIIFSPWFLNNIRKNDKLIINITNDVWFGGTIGAYQHLAIARMRAIELGLPLFRVSNNGISAVIDKFGRFHYKSRINAVEIFAGSYVF
jgi:apolipoprotein N-acyltransferase